MNPSHNAEEMIEMLRPWLRDEVRRAFDSGLAWGLPRCRTDEERTLFPLLLLALSPYSAVVAPRRMPEGGVVSFQVSVSRATPDGVLRHQWSVTSGEGDEEGNALDLSIVLSVDLARERPWEAAARVAAEIQMFLLKSGGRGG